MPDSLSFLRKKLLSKNGEVFLSLSSRGNSVSFSKSPFRDYGGIPLERVSCSVDSTHAVLGWWLPSDGKLVLKEPRKSLPSWASNFREAARKGYAIMEEDVDEKMEMDFPSIEALKAARPDIIEKAPADLCGVRHQALMELMCIKPAAGKRLWCGIVDGIDLASYAACRSVRPFLRDSVTAEDSELLRRYHRLMVEEAKEKIIAFPTRREKAQLRIRALAVSGVFDEGVFRVLVHASFPSHPYLATVHASALRDMGAGFLDGRRVLPDDRHASPQNIRPEYVLLIASTSKGRIIYRA